MASPPTASLAALPRLDQGLALGAQRTSVVTMIMRGAFGQTVLGLALGIPVALFCVRYVQAQLFEIKGLNLDVLAAAVLALALASA